VRLEREELLRLDLALTREWLETDACGGYASSTVLLCNQRRYHGLHVAPFEGNPSRHVFVSRFEEWVHGGRGEASKAFPLSMAHYPGHWSPHGHKSLERFELVPYPSFLYRIGGVEIVREILAVKGVPVTLVRYVAIGGEAPLELRVRPLLACRDAHALTFENLHLDARVERCGGAAFGIGVRPYAALPRVALAVEPREGVHFEADPLWYHGVEYPLDIERGFDSHEDLFSPGVLHLPLAPGEECVVALAIGDPPDGPRSLWASESSARRARLEELGVGPRAQLELGADDFLYRTRPLPGTPRSVSPGRVSPGSGSIGRLGVIAGYPWFGEWGRDTFVSLPGLLLARGRVEECGEALSGALPFLKDGLLPNVFGRDPGESQYGSADASLWFARAVRSYERAGAPRARILAEFRPALERIANAYAAGTALGIGCDEKGLIHAGTPDTNATWMDARTAQGPVTPRDGYAVELDALWYFLLAYLEDLAARANDAAAAHDWRAKKRLAGRTFRRRFWLEDGRYLADTWKDGVPDRSVRPNMVIAAALEFSPLSRGKRTDVVARAELELLTPRGLRTLAPGHPAYRGAFRGGPEERDAAYHQGTVWPWLIGSYCEAYLRAYGDGAEPRAHLAELLAGFGEHLSTHGLNHVSEVFDGDPPHRPGGTFAQAWNTAELLRAASLVREGLP